MSQQIEVICRRCERRDVLDHEISEDYRCSVCNMPAKPEKIEPGKFEMGKPHEIKINMKRWWRCAKHNQTWKRKQPCLECENEELHPLVRNLNPTDTEYQKIRDEIDITKTEWGVMKKIRDQEIALKKAELDMPVLLKQSIKQQAKRDNEILKQLKQISKHLDGNKDGS